MKKKKKLSYRYEQEEKILKYILDKQTKNHTNLKDRVYLTIQKKLNLGDGNKDNEDTFFFKSIMNYLETNGYIKRYDYALENKHVAEITAYGQDFLKSIINERKKNKFSFLSLVIINIISWTISIISLCITLNKN